MAYFDHCASTPPYEEVIQTVTDCMRSFYGNPSSLHRMGADAAKVLSRARGIIAAALKLKPEEIVFTSGATESNNLAVQGAARRFRSRGRHLITTAIEHESVHTVFHKMEKEGFDVTYLPVDATGAVRLEDVKRAVRDDTILVSVMHVNNEMGRIQPIREIGDWLRDKPRTLFHVDAVQSIGKLEADLPRWGVDLFSLSAHKLRGPKGIGLLYKRAGLELDPLLLGGGQEFGMRSGTENVPLIAGMAKAIRMALDGLPENARKLREHRERFLNRLRALDGAVVNGSADSRDMAPHIVNFSLPDLRSEVVVHAMEQRGFYLSSKSACSSGETKPSRVLLAMGCGKQRAASGLRVGFSPDHTAAEVERLADALQDVAKELRMGVGRS